MASESEGDAVSLGLPGHLASRVVNAGIALGSHVIAAVVLAAALASFAVAWFARPEPGVLPALAAIVVVAAALLGVHRRGTVTISIAYLAVGSGATVLAAASLAGHPALINAGGGYVVLALQVALVMVGGAGGGVRRSLVFTLAGLAAGLAASLIAGAITQTPPLLSAIPPLAAVLTATVYVATGLSRRTARNAQPDIQQAAQDEKLAEVRSGVETRAAALLHDTILGSLAAITTDSAGPLSSTLTYRIQTDLDAIIGQDWTERVVTGAGSPTDGPISEALREARGLGLEVELTGDVGQLSRIQGEMARVTGLALRQLFANVRQHSGSPSAEVVLFGEAAAVSIMVIDSGDGFDPEEVAADRFGLRHSVRGRIESVGGSVRIWSTPGKGTSVLLSVPAADPFEQDPGVQIMEKAR